MIFENSLLSVSQILKYKVARLVYTLIGDAKLQISCVNLGSIPVRVKVIYKSEIIRQVIQWYGVYMCKEYASCSHFRSFTYTQTLQMSF